MKHIQAKNYTKVDERLIDYMIVHDMEAPEKGTTAEAVANFFARQPKSPTSGSSAHYCIDNNSIVQCVYDHDVAWAAPGVNHNGLHFEHAGYARQNRHEWADDFSTEMLKLSAQLVAEKCAVYFVPIRFVPATEIKREANLPAGQKRGGITGHLQVTKSGISPSGTHTDPGPNFPWGRYMRYVRSYSNGKTPTDFIRGESK